MYLEGLRPLPFSQTATQVHGMNMLKTNTSLKINVRGERGMRQTDRQTDRQTETESQKQRQRVRDSDRDRETETAIETETERHRHKDRDRDRISRYAIYACCLLAFGDRRCRKCLLENK